MKTRKNLSIVRAGLALRSVFSASCGFVTSANCIQNGIGSWHFQGLFCLLSAGGAVPRDSSRCPKSGKINQLTVMELVLPRSVARRVLNAMGDKMIRVGMWCGGGGACEFSYDDGKF